MAQVQYSVCITTEENVQVDIYTMLYEGQWHWFGSVKQITGYNELGCKEYKMIERVDCGGARYESSAAAIASAVAQFGGAPENWGLASVEKCLDCGSPVADGTAHCKSCTEASDVFPSCDEGGVAR